MSNTNSLLTQFNKGLLEMRELFHESGRLEDSNSKLDEITKLLCLEIASVRDKDQTIPSLKQILNTHKIKTGLVESLNSALVLAGKSKILTNYDGESLLGPNPKFNIAESEESLAKSLTKVVLNSFNGYLRGTHTAKTFEFLNEAFSHFIRDNFRQNIEDAQYMTPPEVVNFMVSLGIERLKEKGYSPSNPPIICDPSCGVGSFLAQFYRVWVMEEKNEILPVLVGQDKVDRMARLSLLNLALFGIKNAKISRGNSLQSASPLDFFTGKCDLIITNPPFGAKFPCKDLSLHGTDFLPCLHDYIQSRNGNIGSELLFLDRYLSLLKPGGTVLAVLPDSVISAAGLPAYLRDIINRDYTIKSITELPAVTFAQAGTRTKTCVLEVQKSISKNDFAFISKVKSLGFEVSSKKGVPYKKTVGKNELTPLIKKFKDVNVGNKIFSNLDVISKEPSIVVVKQDTIATEGWTPSHYYSDRISIIRQIDGLRSNDDVDVLELRSMVSASAKSQRGLPIAKNAHCISVLHIGAFGALNVKELLEYAPKTPGKPCQPGDILFAKINPRIPRAIVVPDLPFELTCSTEFEVMKPQRNFTAFEIMLLLLSENAQKQIQSLTSGTSSSHNRIKTKELMSVKLVVPKKNTSTRKEYDTIIENFATANIRLNEANIMLQETWKSINSLTSF